MSRRNVSPLKTASKSQIDPRDVMIRKLKEDLIVARGRQKELAILQNYLVEIIEKTKLLSADTAKSDQQGKLKLQLTIKTINELKKEVENLKATQKTILVQLSQAQEDEADLKKLLNTKLIQIDKLKKQSASFHNQNEKLLNQFYKLRVQQDEMNHQIRKILETIRDYQGRISQINRKMLQVKSYINQMNDQNHILKDKLKSYQHQNTGIGNDLQQKENKIGNLQRVFAQKHQIIKNQVENYIQLEHQNQKFIKETKHKVNLSKIENDKFNDLTNTLKRLEKTISDREKETQDIVAESNEIRRINNEFHGQNQRLKKDLAACQEHLQNLMKHNAYIQDEMQNILRDDEAIINVIRRKKILPSMQNLRSLRTSRNEQKSTGPTYI